MVIEDEELLLQAIIKKLQSSGYNPISCTTAKQAIDYLKNINVNPDVIWLDYYLPDMNGEEFVKELKINENWKNIPIVVVSNSASDEKKNAMTLLGVDKYLLKSDYKLEEIIKEIRMVVENNDRKVI
jgi:DNA-binding response OmpR family regulator